jgi:hypothetical protein
MSDSGGTREQEIPSEWTALILIIVIGAACGFVVLWFTMLRREQAVLHRTRRGTNREPRLIGDADTMGLFGDDGSADARDSADAGAGDTEDAQAGEALEDPADNTQAAAAPEHADGELVPAGPDTEPAEVETIDPAAA